MRDVSTSPDPRSHRLARLGASRPWLLDIAIVAAIVAIGTLGGPHRHGDLDGRLFTVALALPLLVRRRYPVGVFAVISAIALVQWLADVRSFGDSALLVALYTVAATQPLRTTLVAAGVVETGVALATARWAGPHWQEAFVGLSGMATAAAVLGINVRHRRAALTLLQERAARLEYERDQRGRLAAAAERSRIAREMHDIVAPQPVGDHRARRRCELRRARCSRPRPRRRCGPRRAPAARRSTEMRRLLGVLREEQSPRRAHARSPASTSSTS